MSNKENINKILNWVRVNSPAIIDHLNKPALESDIAKVEIATGITLPDSFKQLINTFNGEDGQSQLAIFGNGNQMLSCENIIEQYEFNKKMPAYPEMETMDFWKDRVHNNVIFVKGAVKPLFTHPKWLPFTCMNGDVYRYLDYDPASDGKMGQVIEVDPEACSYMVLADSFAEFLEDYAQQLEKDEFRVDEDGYIEAINRKDETKWGIPQWLK